MPELPDLINYAKNISTLLINKKIVSAKVYSARNIVGDSARFVQKLTNNKINAVVRDGKQLVFEANGLKFGIHLMLTGRFEYVQEELLSTMHNKLFAMVLCDGNAIVVTDRQGLAKITVNACVSNVPDALSEDFSYMYFISALAKSKRNIKALLTDQSFVKGIGNAYVDEILWAARVDGQSIACKIPLSVTEKLYECVSSVLLNAASTIEKLEPDIISGENRSFLVVHNPDKNFDPMGNPIEKRIVASKPTYYTKAQILYI